MSSVDQRIVEMKFDKAQFEQGVKTVLGKLAELAKGLKLTGATKGLEEVNTAANRFSLANMGQQVSGVLGQFNALQVVAVTALATIAHKAVAAGTQLARSFSIDPLKEGLREYETNLNSIQTIMANTGLKGAEGLGQVNKALDELNHYSDQTIYNFSEMARNIGTFTAAGVDLDVSTNAIKGIANLAAISGSNSQQASTAMYQLSQALAAGRVSLMDWNSVVNAGMGGEVFQNALKETARVHGVAVDDLIKKNGSFRDSLQEGWITTEILTETLSKFTGDLTADQLKSMGYTEQQIAGILEMGQTATDAATKVKTMSQLMGTLREAATSGWAKTWQLIIGDFDQAKELFTGANNVLGGFISASADARNKVIGDWNALGGRTVLIESISNAFNALISVLKPVKDAFRQIFPAKTGQDLYNITVAIRDFTENLKIGEGTANNVKRTFAGFFAIFSIAGQILSGAIDMIRRFFGALSEGSGGFLDFTGGIGDFLVSLDQMLKKSGAIEDFFQGFGDILAVPLRLLSSLAETIGRLFGEFDSSGAEQVSNALDEVGERVQPLQTAGEKIRDFFSRLGDILGRIAEVIGDALMNIGDKIAEVFTADNFNRTLDTINTALLGGIVLLLKRFFSGFSVNLGGQGFFDNVRDALESVSDTMQNMQTNIKANIILKIAGALALLTVSIVALAMIDSGKLTKAMVALTAGFVALQFALVSLSNSIGIIGTAKLPFITAALILLAGALLLMSVSLKIMSTLDIFDTMQALVLLGGALLIIQKAMEPMSKNAAGMLRAAASLLILGVALNAIAVALKIFGTMDWEEIGRGLTALAGSLIIIAGAMRAMPKSMVAQAAALVLLGGAINAIAVALKIFATIDWDEMARGLTALAGSLVIIAVAMRLMPANMLLQAAALIAVGAALNIISLALKTMGGMSWEEIAKGLVTLAGALLILAGGLYLMSGTLGGAAALVVAAGALMILTPVLITLGNLDWGTIVKGLVALAGVFLVLGAAGFILAPVVPVIIGLAAALVLVGAGLALAGVGALAFATAFGIVVVAGAAGVSVLADILATFVNSIPEALAAFGRGIVEFAKAIAEGGPAFFDAFVTIIKSILDAIIHNIPKVGELFLTLLNTGLRILVEGVPRIAEAGLRLIVGLLTAIDNNIGKIVPIAISIVTKFIDGIASNIGRIIQSGVNLILNFINGVADAIRNNGAAVGNAGANLATAIIEGMIRGLGAGIGKIASKAKEVAKSALDAAKNFLGIGSPSKEFYDIGRWLDEGLANGLDRFSGLVYQSAEDVGRGTMVALRDSISDLPTVLEGELALQPTITPVLDLSDVKKDASRIGSLLTAQQLSVDSTYSKATSASAGYRENQRAFAESANMEYNENITFVQNNNSPKALSSAEIYRQTKNQLSVAKGALTTHAR